MNIRDFKAEEMPEDWLKVVFDKQLAVMEKYKEIEGMDEVPVNIHTKAGQRWLKDFLWRTTEELGESYEALEQNNIEHATEELADALHFVTELVLLAGKDQEFVKDDEFSVKETMFPGEAYWYATYRLAMIGNTLKNKPWKQTEMATDEDKFYDCLKLAYHAVLNCFYTIGSSNADIFNYYTRKNQVNKFRQKSHY